MKYLILMIIMSTSFTSDIFARDRHSYNKAESRDERIGKKIKEVFDEKTIAIWMRDRSCPNIHHSMFVDSNSEFFTIREIVDFRLRKYNINYEYLSKKLGPTVNLYSDASRLMITDNNQNELLTEGLKYLLIFHDFNSEDDSIPIAINVLNVVGSAITGGVMSAGMAYSNMKFSSTYLSFNLSIYDIETKDRILAITAFDELNSSYENEYSCLVKVLFDKLYNEVQTKNLNLPNNNSNSSTRNKVTITEPKKESVNLFENPREKRYQ